VKRGFLFEVNMARGRMLNKKICRDLDVHNLSDDTCRLLFSWLIAHLDKEGRTYGDPTIVKSNVFPRRTDLSIETIENYIIELDYACLIFRYENNGDLYIWFPGFDENQVGLRKDREPDSEIPPPTNEQLAEFYRRDDGNHPDNIRQTSGLKEGNIIKKNIRESNNGNINNYENPKLLTLWVSITGMFDIPGDQKEKVIPAFELIYKNYKTDDEFIADGKRYYGEWCKRKQRDGRPYNKQNCSWFYNWWVSGEIPEIAKEIQRELTLSERGWETA